MVKPMMDDLDSIRNVIAASGLPLLTGTLQEIEWARSIRIDRLLEVNVIIARLNRGVHAGDSPHSNLEDAILASRRLRDAEPASWWIANRNTDVAALLRELTHRSYAMESGRI